ncbi:DUF1254 domain-containing protein [Streptacidiphilus jiangxiensis]|uniref:Uncharacterized conserved protein n=1 Tax=Streptacidiphilus jiangxiensis TaxID=235985 RepID=A0A1H7MQF7_STRJI|nr:DUF1254 domain-containing protein [Streptacidiphilus jiangxiensis]SEL13424.1 Uncharacterized conserved protein [Streptacidiphilus jiangxiensis]
MLEQIEFEGGLPKEVSAQASFEVSDRRRAVEAYRFFYPTVSLESILRGTRAGGAVDNESAPVIVARPIHVGFTLNSDTPYLGGGLDLRKGGPMVIELPPGPLVGLVDDHYHRWLVDLGLPGRNGPKGGKVLLLPPGHEGTPDADGYEVVRSDTWQVLFALRALPLGGDLHQATALMRTVKIYAWDLRDAPPAFGFTDIGDQPMDTTPLAVENNLEFWKVLHSVVDTEPAVDELRPMLGLLAELGIEAGRPFAPDARMAQILTEAARQGRDEMLVSAFASRRPDRIAWPDRTWEWVGLRPENGTFERQGSLDVEAKDRWFAQAIVASPAMFRRDAGAGSLYWLGHRDSTGAYLDGGRSYRLRVPLPVPYSLFWSVTAYDAQTRSEVVTDQGRAALRSMFEKVEPEAADHVDLYFGPEPPTDGEGRWIQTAPGRGWFAYFRIYGPEQAAFDGDWRPGDFEALD